MMQLASLLVSTQAAQLHARVRRSRDSLSPQAWRDYLSMAQSLPALIRENGLASTVWFLEQRSGSKPGVARLRSDWTEQPTTSAGLSGLARAAAAQREPAPWKRGTSAYRTATLLALDEAQLIRRSAEALDAAAPAASPSTEGPAEHPSAPGGLPSGAVAVPSAAAIDRALHVGTPGREHPGLLWRHGGVDILAPAGADGQYKARHVADVLGVMAEWSRTGHASQYAGAFGRWQQWVSRCGATRKVATVGRLQLGVGAPTVFETQVLLHPVHGMPYIPGSTLKGALRAFLTRRLEGLPDDEPNRIALCRVVDTLLGVGRDNDHCTGGELSVLDAWWVPGLAPPLVREVETPHHGDYYRGARDVASAFDDPVPVTQLAVQGSFLLGVHRHPIGDAWANQVLDWLCAALADEAQGGLGAKAFSAGSGRLRAVAAG